MDVHFEPDEIVYVCHNYIYHSFSLMPIRTTQDFFYENSIY